jgi:hypothetical protein
MSHANGTLVLCFSASLLAAGLTSPVARATNHIGTGSGTFDPTALNLGKEDFLIRLQKLEGERWVFASENDLLYLFNRANCQCETPVRVVVETTQTGRLKLSAQRASKGVLRVRVGNSDCVARDARRMTAECEDLATTTDITNLVRAPLEVVTTVAKLFERAPTGGAQPDSSPCSREGTSFIWLWIDTEPDDLPDSEDAPNFPIKVHGSGPMAPRDVRVTSGNEALEVEWTGVTEVADFQGYVVLCGRGDIPVFEPGTFSPRFDTPAGLCPERTALPFTVGASYLTEVPREGQRGPAPPRLQALDPAFLCSNLLTSQTRTRISVLQNGIPYVVGVASVDRYGNASAIEEAVLQVPIPTVDFYRSYRDAGGEAEGGFCAVARAPSRDRPGRHLLFGLLAPLAALALRIRRWRRDPASRKTSRRAESSALPSQRNSP